MKELNSSSLLTELSVIFLVLSVLSAAFWVLIGRFKLHNLLINIYISFAIMQVVSKQTEPLGKYAPGFIFLGLIVFFTIIDNSVFEIHLSGSGLKIWQVIVLSFLEAGLFVSIVGSLLFEKQIFKYVSEKTMLYFVSPWACIAWMVSPLVFLILIGKRGK